MRFQEVTEVVKRTLVELAEEEITKKSTKVNSSRISIITGLHRRDVSRIRVDGQTKSFVRGGTVARVLNRWSSESEFLTKGGRPRVLTVEGEDSEFATLVRLESTDLNPGTVMFELIRIGAAHRTREGLKFLDTVFESSEDMDDGWGMLAQDVKRLTEAVTRNLEEPEILVNHHLSTSFDNVFVKDVGVVRRWLAEQGKLFHRKALKFLSSHDKDLIKKRATDSGGVSVALCSFALIESHDEPAAEQPK